MADNEEENTSSGGSEENGSNNESSGSENTSESGNESGGENGSSESGGENGGSENGSGEGGSSESGGSESGSNTGESGGNTSGESGTTTGTGEQGSGTGTTTDPSSGTGTSTGESGTSTGTGDTPSGGDTPTPTPTNETTGDDIVEPPKIPTESDAQEAAKEQENAVTTDTSKVNLPKFNDPTMDRSSEYYKGPESLQSLQTNRTVLLNHPLTVEVAGSDNMRRVKPEGTFQVEDTGLGPAIENVLSKVDKPDAALKVKVIENNINSITDELKRLADDADKAIKYWEELQKKPSQELLANKLSLLQQLYTCGAIEHDIYAEELGTVAKELGYSFTISKEGGGKKKKKNP